MTTDKQKKAVIFCEKWLNITFTGDMNDYNNVNNFLSNYLDEAKIIANDASESYYSYINDK